METRVFTKEEVLELYDWFNSGSFNHHSKSVHRDVYVANDIDIVKDHYDKVLIDKDFKKPYDEIKYRILVHESKTKYSDLLYIIVKPERRRKVETK